MFLDLDSRRSPHIDLVREREVEALVLEVVVMAVVGVMVVMED